MAKIKGGGIIGQGGDSAIPSNTLDFCPPSSAKRPAPAAAVHHGAFPLGSLYRDGLPRYESCGQVARCRSCTLIALTSILICIQ